MTILKESSVSVDVNGLTKLVQNLKVLQVKDATGKLTIALANLPAEPLWHVFFNQGQILWIVSREHRMRGWLRAIKQGAPQLLTESWLAKMTEMIAIAQLEDYCWELQLLNQAIQRQAITQQQAQTVIQTRLQELCLSLADGSQLSLTWLVSPQETESIVTGVAVDQVLKPVLELCQQWRTQLAPELQAASLQLSLNHALVILQPDRLAQKVPAQAYPLLTRLLNGRSSLWDIAQQMQKPIIPLLQSLLPLFKEQMVQLREIPDLKIQPPKHSPTPTPTPQRAETLKATTAGDDRSVAPIKSMPSSLHSSSATVASRAGQESARRSIIACIDDSPTVAKELEAILKPMGYELLHIIDPVQGVSNLLKHKPALIFLDVMMPNINGYEFCTFLRKTAAFKDIPIVMLTSHNGLFDRMRAKNVGSSDFMSKPPSPNKVAMIVNKFLTNSTSPLASSG
jgi:two-component system, chemotaxis family, response regulator PixG